MESTKYTAWLVRDTFGGSKSGVTQCSNDTVFIDSLLNPQGYSLCFEAEFYHLERWCEENGLELITEEGSHQSTFTEAKLDDYS